jgi:hypothetical protein
MLQENLCGVGSGSTVMIVNVGPAANDFDETVHALKYGALARDITIAPPKVDSRYVKCRLCGHACPERMPPSNVCIKRVPRRGGATSRVTPPCTQRHATVHASAVREQHSAFVPCSIARVLRCCSARMNPSLVSACCPALDSSWNNILFGGEAGRRLRVSQLEDEGSSSSEMARVWEAQRAELISQIEDLQCQVSSLRCTCHVARHSARL